MPKPLNSAWYQTDSLRGEEHYYLQREGDVIHLNQTRFSITQLTVDHLDHGVAPDELYPIDLEIYEWALDTVLLILIGDNSFLRQEESLVPPPIDYRQN